MANTYDLPRYCGHCGEIFNARDNGCPECGTPWPKSLPEDRLACYALLLTEIQQLRNDGSIVETTFRTLRRIYEERLIAIRPPRSSRPAAAFVPAPAAPIPVARPVAGLVQAAAAATPAPAPPSGPWRSQQSAPRAAPAVPPRPPKPPSHITRDLKNWAARRQADLVLYLGAFLLSISALIFVSYTGSGGMAKSALFGVYTALFLVLGMQLGKWKRVQEAGPVFLAIGAILTPLNFVALYTNVLRGEDVAREYVWLVGSLGTAALYALLAWRGYGRFYWAPSAVACAAAYASLGASLRFPAEWFGPWFLVAAVAGAAGASRVPAKFRKYVEIGSVGLGTGSILFTHFAVLAEGAQHGTLPAAYLLASLGLARLSFPGRQAAYLAALPPSVALTAASAAWSVDGWAENAVAWAPAWILAAAAGYLAIARIKPALASSWAVTSLFAGAAGVSLAHAAVFDGDIAWRLPAAYAMAAAISGAWFLERRYPAALALVPAGIAAALASAFWAAEVLAFEWLGSFAAAAGLGYVLTARLRASEGRLWGSLAAAAGAIALAYSHIAAAEPGIFRWELATAYAMVVAGAGFDAFRFRPASVVALFGAAAGSAAAFWAWDIGTWAWAFPGVSLAILVVATELVWNRDLQLAKFAWPSAFVLSLAPLALIAPYIDEPWAGVVAFAGTAATMFGLAFRTRGAFARIIGYDTPTAATIEQQMLARLGCWALFAAGGFADRALGLSPVESAWTFAGTAIVLWLAVAGFRRYVPSLDQVLGPVGLSALIIAVPLAQSEPGQVAMILALAGVAAALATGGKFAMLWRGAYLVSAALAVLTAHGWASDAGTGAWQLPAAYALALVALLWDSAWNRWQPAMLFVPAVASLGAGATIWWQSWGEQNYAWTPLAFALGIVASEELWKRGQLLREIAWPYVLVLGLAPLTLIGPYDTHPWYAVGGFALSSTAWTAATVRSRGAIAGLLGFNQEANVTYERQALAVGAFALGLATIAYANVALEVPQVRAAWTAFGATMAAWAAIVVFRRKLLSFEEILGPASLQGIAVAVFASYPHHGHTAMILGLTAVAAALAAGGRYANAWRLSYLAAAVGGVLFAHNHAELVSRDAWQLPAAYGLALAALLWDSAWNRYQPAMVGVPPIAVAAATAAVWWQDWPLQQFAWAPLAVARALTASETLWTRGAITRKAGWPYALIFSLAPFALVNTYRTEVWAGNAAFALAAVAWAITAWRSRGTVGELFDLRTALSLRGEQQATAVGAFGLGLISLGYFQSALEVPLATAGWAYAGAGLGVFALSSVPTARFREWLNAFTVAGAAAFAVALGAAGGHTGESAIMYGFAATGLAASGLLNRSGGRVIAASIVGAVSAANAWAWADWPLWSLALTYAGVAAMLFVGLAPKRKSRTFLPNAVTFLSVAPIMVSVALSTFAVFIRQLDDNLQLFNEAFRSESLVRTSEWAAMAITVLISGLMVAGEGLYRKGRGYTILGSAIVLLAAELGIAMLQAENVQVYTVPVALYLLGLGLATRESQPLFSHHMLLHESLFVLGAAVLVLPPAEQSFAPGGANWGLLVIAEGMALLALGLSTFQRWLAVSGVVTLVTVAARFVFDNSNNGNIPYWAMLGAAGLALLGVGVLMLLERDWWDRTKARIGRWWIEGEHLGSPPAAPVA